LRRAGLAHPSPRTRAGAHGGARQLGQALPPSDRPGRRGCRSRTTKAVGISVPEVQVQRRSPALGNVHHRADSAPATTILPIPTAPGPAARSRGLCPSPTAAAESAGFRVVFDDWRCSLPHSRGRRSRLWLVPATKGAGTLEPRPGLTPLARACSPSAAETRLNPLAWKTLCLHLWTQRTTQPWRLVRGSSFWREATLSRRVLSATAATR